MPALLAGGTHVKSNIRNLAGHFGPKAAKAISRIEPSALREIETMQRAFWKAHHQARAKCGLTALAVASAQAEKADYLALMRLCKTRPRTRAGMKALLEYLGPLYQCGELPENYARNRGGFDLFNTLAAAVEAL